MIRKLKYWLIHRYFPAAAKEEIAQLLDELAQKKAEIERLNSYIDGLSDGIRAQRRVVIHNEVKK